MRQRFVRLLLLLTVLLIAATTAHATCGGGGGGGMGGIMPRSGNPQVYAVPWKVLNDGVSPPLATPRSLYWFPADLAQARGADLLTARSLTLYSAQCVGMQLVHPEDTASAAKWEMTGKLPAALLVADGKVISRVDNEGGALKLGAVEKIVKEELSARETALDAQLDEAEKIAKGGDKDAAVAAYQK